MRHAGGERAGRGRVIVDAGSRPGLRDQRRGTGLVQALLARYQAGAGLTNDDPAEPIEADDCSRVRAEQLRGALADEREQRIRVPVGIGTQRRDVGDRGVQASQPALRGKLL